MFSDLNTVYVDLFLQIIVIILLAFAVTQASKDPYGKHCKFIIIAVTVQLLSVIAFMLPSMYSLSGFNMSSSFNSIMYLHHLSGLAVIIFTIYIKLSFSEKIPSVVDPLKMMKITLLLWILTFLGGFYLYLVLWEGIILI
ncbi:hypothetical protein [Methanolobus bombayensis]|uniref:hypothetical protein n=1 Tax=Methanolobus bombayensis TaxID=38023 RepID=UPI001AE585CD|nr:hypothetical protein [Methanolobus bombayensis]MBP1908864.1 putative membrane protein [Methanolobus bombayensis]